MDPTTRYTVQERLKIVEAYFATKSVVLTQRQFRRDFTGRNLPSKLTIRRLLEKFRETRSVGRPRSAMTANNIETLRRRLEELPKKSIRRLSQETDLSRKTVRRIKFPYKIQLLQAQTAANKEERWTFCVNISQLIEDHPTLLYLIFSVMRHISTSVDTLISRLWDSGPRPNLMSMSFAPSVSKMLLCGVSLVVAESLDPTFLKTSSDNQHWAICGNDEEEMYPSVEEKAGGRHEYCHLSTGWRNLTLLKYFTGIPITVFLWR